MRNKRYLLILLIFSLGNTLFAQSIRFNKAFPVISGLSAASYGIMNESGGYILYGGTFDTMYYSDPAIVKIDSLGNILWQKHYPRAGYYFSPFAVANELGINVPWGGEIAEIDWYSDTTSLFVFWGLYRFDGNGDTLWSKAYQDTSAMLTDQIIITRNKKYLIYGAWANYSDPNWGFGTLFLRKTDSLGNIIWTRTYQATNSHDRLADGIDTCQDGGYILCAWDYDTIANYSKEACRNGEIMVMKTDSGGNIQWIKYITNPLCDVRAGAIRALKNGGYAVCGYWDDSLNWNGEIAFAHMYLAKLNDTGSLIWSHTYGVSDIADYNTLANLREMPNGDIIACGNGDTLGKHLPGVILRTDSNGNQKWLNYYTKLSPPDDDYLTDVQLTIDGGFISSGSTYGNPEDFWVIKTDSLGCSDSAGCNYSTGITELRTKSEGLRVFPNPSSGVFTMQLAVGSGQLAVVVYNVLGEKVTPTLLPQSRGGASFSCSINLSGQPNGVYFYRVLREDGGLVGEGKLVIQK